MWIILRYKLVIVISRKDNYIARLFAFDISK